MTLRPIIEIQNLTKSFQHWTEKPESLKSILVHLAKGNLRAGLGEKHKFTVLKDVCFDIKQGEFIGIMGVNGIGKSTLFKLIAGIYTPTSGKISVRGQITPLIELGAGFHPDLSGYENIFLNAAIIGFGRHATWKAFQKIWDFSELGDKIHMPVKNFSSGMLVRLGFSIAAHLNAEILLFDEILAVGDEGFQQKCLTKVAELHQQGRTIVLISHNSAMIRDHCQRCIVISNQTVAFDGSPGEGVNVYKSLVGV